jgi:hypothetical protein
MFGLACLFGTISLAFWLLHIPSHRRPGTHNKIPIPRMIAMFAGSENNYVNWRSFSIQLGFVAFFLSNVLLIFLQVKHSSFYASGFTLVFTLVVQVIMRRLYGAYHLG